MANTNLGLIGSTGRMGQALIAHLAQVDDIRLAAEHNRHTDLQEFLAHELDVVVDLSKGEGVDTHGPAVVKRGIPYIVGATGYKPVTVELLTGLSDAADCPVLIVPNFSLGANLMIRFAAQAARLMEAPVITERHHMGKADAPSGTALFTAQRIVDALHSGTRQVVGQPPVAVKDSEFARNMSSTLNPRQARGPVPPALANRRFSTADHFAESHPGVLGAALEGVAIHSIRGDGYLAEQEVRFSLPGESLSIEHRSIDRRCFMSGIIYAIRNIGRVRGLVIGLDAILEL